MDENKKDYLTKMKEIIGFVDAGKTSFIGTVVNSKKMENHLKELESIIEMELKEAQNIREQESAILDNARRQAKEIINDAKEDVLNQDISIQADNYAREVVYNAESEAAKIMKNAKNTYQKLIISGHKYLEDVFEEMADNTKKQLQLLLSNRDEIRGGLQEQVEKIEEFRY